MNVQELYDAAKAVNALDRDVEEVMTYLKSVQSPRNNATCANCSNRDTEACSFPQSSKLYMPACLTFKHEYPRNEE